MRTFSAIPIAVLLLTGCGEQEEATQTAEERRNEIIESTIEEEETDPADEFAEGLLRGDAQSASHFFADTLEHEYSSLKRKAEKAEELGAKQIWLVNLTVEGLHTTFETVIEMPETEEQRQEIIRLYRSWPEQKVGKKYLWVDTRE